MINEIETFVDTINDFEYNDYLEMCNQQNREPQDEKSEDFAKWNSDMKNLVYRLFLRRLDWAPKAKNEVLIKARGDEDKTMMLNEFMNQIVASNNKLRFVRESDPDKLSLLVIDEEKHQKTYKMTFTDENLTYDNIFTC